MLLLVWFKEEHWPGSWGIAFPLCPARRPQSVGVPSGLHLRGEAFRI